MDFIILAGPQAVGKMTVGQALEKKLDAKLLFNHQTIDLFADFLDYTPETFRLSELVRTELFKAFVENKHTNKVKGIIFTVVVAFDLESDWQALKEWLTLFHEANANLYFVELEANLNERLSRNKHEDRLKAKPSKRNLAFSENELLTSYEKHRLNSFEGEVKNRLPMVHYLKLNNTKQKPEETAEDIYQWMKGVQQ